jgi:hypothetical protein
MSGQLLIVKSDSDRAATGHLIIGTPIGVVAD